MSSTTVAETIALTHKNKKRRRILSFVSFCIAALFNTYTCYGKQQAMTLASIIAALCVMYFLIKAEKAIEEVNSSTEQ